MVLLFCNLLGLHVIVAVQHHLFTMEAGFDIRAVSIGFVVDVVAWQ